MASYENKDMNLVEMDLEVFEIDEALLRELLEEDQEGKNHGNGECMAESVEENIAIPETVDSEQEQQQQQQNCLEKYECHDFEWLNMMDMMEPTNSLNDVRMNWLSDDNVGMVDFGYPNEECYSQIYDGLAVSNEACYGCLWEDCDI